ncbi:MAG: hypothetical protein V2B18_02135 [Pseudomonadota bacterium]
MKCDACNYVSFEYSLTCPNCNKDVKGVRARLGITLLPPEVDLDSFFTGGSGTFKTKKKSNEKAELDLDHAGEDFEFTMDD